MQNLFSRVPETKEKKSSREEWFESNCDPRFLVPPTLCSTTARDQGTLGSLDNALNRTNLWDTLNHLNNVTCLGPNNNGFANAGNPDSALNTSQLTNALL